MSDSSTATDGPLLAFDGASFAWDGGRPVVDGVRVEVRAGEILGVIGPNGAGKSTLVRLALGLLSPTAGRVLVDGRDVARWRRRDFARVVAAVLQEEGYEFPFAALEVVLMGRTAHLGPLGFEREEDLALARAAMVATGSDGFADRPIDQLSGGERKRVLLARALAQDPRLLVLDEPAAALDVHHQLAIFDRLRERARAGVGVLVVVHDLNLAAAYCDRLLLVRADAPAIAGPVDEILTPARVREAFGVEIAVATTPDGRRVLVPTAIASGAR